MPTLFLCFPCYNSTFVVALFWCYYTCLCVTTPLYCFAYLAATLAWYYSALLFWRVIVLPTLLLLQHVPILPCCFFGVLFFYLPCYLVALLYSLYFTYLWPHLMLPFVFLPCCSTLLLFYLATIAYMLCFPKWYFHFSLFLVGFLKLEATNNQKKKDLNYASIIFYITFLRWKVLVMSVKTCSKVFYIYWITFKLILMLNYIKGERWAYKYNTQFQEIFNLWIL